MPNKNKGQYVGTEINEKWWRRYTRDKLLVRGNGEYWFDVNGFYFLRSFSKKPIFISFRKIEGVKAGKWHSGRWVLGNVIIKVIWKKNGVKLSSGFIVSKHKEGAMKLKKFIEERIKINKK